MSVCLSVCVVLCLLEEKLDCMHACTNCAQKQMFVLGVMVFICLSSVFLFCSRTQQDGKTAVWFSVTVEMKTTGGKHVKQLTEERLAFECVYLCLK